MRVLILTYIFTDYDPRYGGEGRVVWETTHALARAGVEVFVVTSLKNFKTTPHPSIHLYQIPFHKKFFLNFDAGELLKIFLFSIPLIYIKNIDLIHHLPTNGPDPFARFKFGRVFAESADPAWDYENPKFGAELRLDNATKQKAAGIADKRWHEIDFWPRLARRVFKILGVDDKFPKNTDIFFSRARVLIPTLKEIRPESIVEYVPNGVNTTEFSPNNPPLFARTQKGLRFLHVGSVSRRKGVHYLLKAFISILPKYPDNELLIVGRGEMGYVEDLKKIAAPHPQISFHDNIDNNDLPGVYTSVDMFCLVPLGNSTPTVLSEAMASGLATITTSDSGCGEVVEEYDAGYLVEPGDSAAIAMAMIRAIENKQELASKSAKALAASKFFSWDYLANQLIAGYKKALALKAPTNK